MVGLSFMKPTPKISIVVNTNGRANALRQTIESFRHLAYPDFEVCVVVGPTRDGSHELAEQYSRRGILKAATCEVMNLSVSRNIGIRMGAGEIVAFIDDDAFPEPEWLSDLAAIFGDDRVLAGGGRTFDHTGYAFQSQFMICDRFGDAVQVNSNAEAELYSYPFAARYPGLLGTNSAFRRSTLVTLGGFDEEFEYYLDETDVCCRLVDAGGLVRQSPNAYVHHKFLASHLRNEKRALRNPFPVIKNKIYFSLVNNRGHHSIDEIIRHCQGFCDRRREDMRWCVENGLMNSADLERLDEVVERAWRGGLERGLAGSRRVQPSSFFEGADDEFRPFPGNALGEQRRTFVFLSQTYPPTVSSGNARHTHDIAQALGEMGHIVHVLTKGADADRLDFEDSVWVHRVVPRETPPYRLPSQRTVPAEVWNYSRTMLEEIFRIEQRRRVDAVEAVSWDCEGAAVALDGSFPLAINLVTSFATYLSMHPQQQSDEPYMERFGLPMLELEELIFASSPPIIAASQSIVDEVEQRRNVKFAHQALSLCPHGLADMTLLRRHQPRGVEKVPGRLVALFVGRLEIRKGIDTLLEAIPRVLEQDDNVECWIAGRDDTLGGEQYSISSAFRERHSNKPWAGRVHFLGEMTDEELRWLYANCDVLVAPSRFESFGLIFVEAMMFGKPVIGCRAGGVPEVVEHGGTGLLVPPDDPPALSEAISRLLGTPSLAATMGRRGKDAYERRFRAEHVAALRCEILARVARRKLELTDVKIDGASRVVSNVGVATEGILLEHGSTLSFNSEAGEAFITFWKHPWSGFAEVSHNGKSLEIVDLFDAEGTWETIRMRVEEKGVTEVRRIAKRSTRAHDDEVIVTRIAIRPTTEGASRIEIGG